MAHYLDHAATTPVRPEAAQAALDAMTRNWGNPSSRYEPGAQAAGALEGWRQDIASTLRCAPEELCFTSCGTEGDNWAIFGAVALNRRKGKHIVTTAIEHSAVLEPCKELERQGYEITYLQPDRSGTIPPEAVQRALRQDTILVSMMLVNNELGTVLPVGETARAIRESGCAALLHCDAVQAFLKIPFAPKELGVDFLSVSGHKIHAPKGIGALYIRAGLRLPPMLYGGGQEHGLRPGTEPTAQIAAFAAAARLGYASMARDTAHMQMIKEYALSQLSARLPQVVQIGAGDAPHILPISLPGYKSEVLVRFLSDRGIYVSSGSACHKGKPSHVFAALRLDKAVQDGVLRLSFGYDTQHSDIDALVRALGEAGEQLLQSMS